MIRLNIRQRFSILFSICFMVLLGTVMTVVYSLFAEFRKDEFKARLQEKAITTVKFMVEVEEIDEHLLRLIDSNTLNKLYNEKTLIFNDQYQLVYSSIDDAPLKWTVNELKEIKTKGKMFGRRDGYEVFAIYYHYQGANYYVLTSADDKYGKSNLNYLRIIFFVAFIVGSAVIWALSFFVSKRALAPLELLKEKIVSITEHNLNTRIEVKNPNDEVGALATSFNSMLERIDHSYTRQRNFTANASHELKTPVTRIVTSLENLSEAYKETPHLVESFSQLSANAYQLSDIVTSLLLLSKIENKDSKELFFSVRVDELLFREVDLLKRQYPGMRFQFEIDSSAGEPDLSLMGDETLLRIAFSNLIKNAYLYSSDEKVKVLLQITDEHTCIVFKNNGPFPSAEDREQLFTPFRRGTNATGITGSGIGLSIVKRIFDHHTATVQFHIAQPDVNIVTVTFLKHS
ncbi:MAG: HAMP domain-containing histidine kinase [Chitinophagaceae bacterium]|nr:HAMP domain-containing histidine kinase [Chitinophagaceae bacterium]